MSVSGGWQAGPLDPAVPVIASIESPPLATIVSDMLTRSDNDTAEMLVKELGFSLAQPGTTESGLEVLERTVSSWGVPMAEVVFADGSGLSAENRLTCDTLVAVLDHLEQTPAVDGLPVAGRSGTLIDEFSASRSRGASSARRGRSPIRLPTPNPPEVKALAGYLEAPNGETCSLPSCSTVPGT